MDATHDLFGQVARRRGFITDDQLQQAVEKQGRRSNGAPRLLGLIMLDEGFVTTGQLIEVLREVRALTTQQWIKRTARAPHIKGKAKAS